MKGGGEGGEVGERGEGGAYQASVPGLPLLILPTKRIREEGLVT